MTYPARIIVIGGGLMGLQVASLYQCLGVRVILALKSLAEIDNLAKKIKMNQRMIRKALSSNIVHSSCDIEYQKIEEIAPLNGDVVIECISEDLHQKQELLKFLFSKYSVCDICEIYTNTSSLDIGDLQVCGIKKRVDGLHFFNPIFSILIIETTVSAQDLSKKMVFGPLTQLYTIIPGVSCRGYIGNRLLFPIIKAYKELLIDEDVSPEYLSKVACSLGLPDIESVVKRIGNDTVEAILLNLS